VACFEAGNIGAFVVARNELCIKPTTGKLKRPRCSSHVSPCVLHCVIINVTTGNELRMFDVGNKTE